VDQGTVKRERKKTFVSSIILLALFLLVWQLTTRPAVQGKSQGLPGPAAVRQWLELLANGPVAP